MTQIKHLLMVFLASIALGGVATASSVDFSFSKVGAGGTMTYNGTTTTVTGMTIWELVVSGAPINNGLYFIDGTAACPPAFPNCGTADSTTGPKTGTSGGVVSFGPGGSIDLFGSVDLSPGGTQVIPFGAIITTGTYASATLDTTTGILTALGGVGSDTKDSRFLAFFGIPATTNPFSFDFKAGAKLPNGYVPGSAAPFAGAPIVSGSVDNTAAVPEPATLALLGAGLLGLGTLFRRKLSARN